jgi:hypothetical protein
MKVDQSEASQQTHWAMSSGISDRGIGCMVAKFDARHLLTIRRQLGRDIGWLKRLYGNCSRQHQPGKKRFAFYEYLYQVYAMHAHWRTEAQHLLKLIVDASCTADHKRRSRWGQALRYVWRRRKYKATSRRKFDSFLHSHAGVAGCASKVATTKIRSVEGRLGVG